MSTSSMNKTLGSIEGEASVLGRRYQLPQDCEMLEKELFSRVWCTYRNGMEPIAQKFSTDAGWGCMLRCGQMLLCQCLLVRHLGRDFKAPGGSHSYMKYREILSWFLDIPYLPYSIHRIAERGTAFDKKIGEWFGPTTISQVLKCLVDEHRDSGIAAHIAMDGVVYVEDILRLSVIKPGSNSPLPIPDPFPSPSSERARNADDGEEPGSPGMASWKPILLLIPLRLGLHCINTVYVSQLKNMFTYPQSVGIVGGKPNAAYYFVGTAGDNVLYLDPHTVQPSVDRDELNDFSTESYHCPKPKWMKIVDMDTSLALGFFFRRKSDFNDFCFHCRNAINDSGSTPLFTIMDKKHSVSNLGLDATIEQSTLRGNNSGSEGDCDDYEML
eukprot:Nk52_evm80s224 gene=Nk52_evmTU80s224